MTFELCRRCAATSLSIVVLCVVAGCGRSGPATTEAKPEGTAAPATTAATMAPTTTAPVPLTLSGVLSATGYTALSEADVHQFVRISTKWATTYVVTAVPQSLDSDAAEATLAYVEGLPERYPGATLSIDAFGDGNARSFQLQRRDPDTKERFVFLMPEGSPLPLRCARPDDFPPGRTYGETCIGIPAIAKATTIIRVGPSTPTLTRSIDAVFGIEVCQSAINLSLDVGTPPTVNRGVAGLQAMEVFCNTVGQEIGFKQTGSTEAQVRQSLSRPVTLHTATQPYHLLPFDDVRWSETPTKAVFQ